MDVTEGSNMAPGTPPYAPPPIPPYYQPATNQFWSRLMQEKDRLAGLLLGALGGCLIFISTFVSWRKMEDYDSYYGYMSKTPKPTTFYAPLLMLSLALLAGVLLAYVWRERAAGSVFSVIIAGGVLGVGFGFAVAQVVSAGAGSSSFIGTGAYLGLAGGLLGLLGGLLLLPGRKARN
jgi:hypothetical protein